MLTEVTMQRVCCESLRDTRQSLQHNSNTALFAFFRRFSSQTLNSQRWCRAEGAPSIPKCTQGTTRRSNARTRSNSPETWAARACHRAPLARGMSFTSSLRRGNVLVTANSQLPARTPLCWTQHRRRRCGLVLRLRLAWLLRPKVGVRVRPLWGLLTPKGT